jgi:murein DD-endopeptidase MepM/ murein hydrolase activator NlpD
MKAHALRLTIAILLAARSSAASLVYQPSPYRGTDLWITNYYAYNDDYGVNDSRLRVGGSGDWYSTALRFDLEGLPANPSQVVMGMYAYSSGDGSTPVGMNAYALTNEWNENSGWYSTNWTGYSLGQLPAPALGRFNGILISSLYKQWKNGSLPNKGLYFSAMANDNRFNVYYSSDFSVPSYRPYIYVEYTETVTPPAFKLPLPGGRRWVVTTEIGGLDHKHSSPNDPEYKDTYHTDDTYPGNYFCLDFGASSIPAYSGDIPIYAAAGGKVIVVDSNQYNGNYVVIDHDFDGREDTGFTTRYLHFKYWPSVAVGQTVSQGALLGYMGNSGASKGSHLHFGVRYNGKGYSYIPELAFVKLEGLCLKQYQTEADLSGNRTSNSYFPSTNSP